MTDRHRKYIATLNCVICMDNVHTEACHVRFPDPRCGKPDSGTGHKPPDFFCVPLCHRHHMEQHDHGDERAWWAATGIDPIMLAVALFVYSGDYQIGCAIVDYHHQQYEGDYGS